MTDQLCNGEVPDSYALEMRVRHSKSSQPLLLDGNYPWPPIQIGKRLDDLYSN